MKKLLACLMLVAAIGTAAARPVDDNDPNTLPVDGLALYDGYRAPLLAKGWAPIPNPSAYKDGFSEVVCGNAICTADWESPAGGTVSFTLWPRYTTDDRLMLYLAPATSE